MVKEFKKGFKKTEVGLIPEDWDVVPMQKITKLMTNGFVGLAKSHYTESNDGIKYIQGFNVKANSYNFTGIKKVTPEFHKKNQKSQLKEGDLLTVQTGDVGLTTIVNKELEGSNCHALIISRFKEKDVFPWFYAQYFNSESGRARLVELEIGTTMKHINVGDLIHWLVPLPPTIEEQKSIATALSDIDELITGLEKLISKKKDIKQGGMQQLLTPPHEGGKRLPGFSGGWVEKTLGEVGECIRGVSYSGNSDLYPFDNNNSIRLLRSNNIYDKKIVFADLQYVKKEKVNPHQVILPKDVLICMANGSKALVGKAGQFNGANMKYTFGAFMGIFRPKIDECDRDFIFNLFSTNSFRCHLDVQLSGSSINNLKPSDIEDFKFYSPNYTEQKAISQILSDMDAEINQLETKKEKYYAIKQGMIQELLTGKTRLL